MSRFFGFGQKGGSRSPERPISPSRTSRALSSFVEDGTADREFLLKKEWLRAPPVKRWQVSPAAEEAPAAGSCCRSSRGYSSSWAFGSTLLAAAAGLLLACWSVAVAVHATESCARHGCGKSRPGQHCHCHLDCITKGTCCPDYGDQCAEEDTDVLLAPPEAESCAVYGCVDFTPENACQCHSHCESHGNCCGDYFAACADGAAGSCAIYGCSLERREHACQCYPDCAHDGDCCEDYVDTCRGRASGIIATRRTSTAMSTSITETSATSTTTTFFSTTTTLDPDADPVPLEGHYDAPPPGFGGYSLFYSGDNPLRVRASERREDNYFLIIGDWGTPGGPGECQLAVAEAMKRYVGEQRDMGRNLLFIGTVGDNFYWTGVVPQSWEVSWATPYGVNDPGSPLFQVPWLATLGNHDYGNDDTYAFCPGAKPHFSIHGQPYAARQMNRDRNPKRPRPSDLNTTHFWFPDYSYHYSIPEAGVEVISFDTNAGFVDILGGDAGGNRKAFRRCSGQGAVQDFLSRVEQASTDLLVRRAQEGTATTVVLLQHYPGRCQREVFMDALPDQRRGVVRVLCAYGHVHDQKCEGGDGAACDAVMTGGGGGCCDHAVQAGFTAVGLTADGGFEVDVESEKVKLPARSCRWK